MIPIDLGADYHVLSAYSDGAHSLQHIVQRATEQELTVLGCVERVQQSTTWLPEFTHQVRQLQRTTHSTHLISGVETKMLDASGRLDLPRDLTGVDRVYIADHEFPVAAGVFAAWRVHRALKHGWLTPDVAIRSLIHGLTRAVDECPRPAVLAQPFSVLSRVGLSPDRLTPDLLEPLIHACLRRGALIELNERWQSPNLRTALWFFEAGVPVVAATSARTQAEMGRYSWAQSVATSLSEAA